MSFATTSLLTIHYIEVGLILIYEIKCPLHQSRFQSRVGTIVQYLLTPECNIVLKCYPNSDVSAFTGFLDDSSSMGSSGSSGSGREFWQITIDKSADCKWDKNGEKTKRQWFTFNVPHLYQWDSQKFSIWKCLRRECLSTATQMWALGKSSTNEKLLTTAMAGPSTPYISTSWHHASNVSRLIHKHNYHVPSINTKRKSCL